MNKKLSLAAAALALLAAFDAAAESREELERQVRDAETAFASTMAQRDLEAFGTFIADEAIFFGQGALRGRDAVIEAWKGFYEGKAAPFSWRPETVAVLDSGQLALSSGPVFDPSGKQVAVFNSIWRREPDGRWRVIFDKGAAYCPPPPPGKR